MDPYPLHRLPITLITGNKPTRATIAEVKADAKAGCKVSQEALIQAGLLVRITSNKPFNSPPIPELYGYDHHGRPRRDIRPL
jgi:hypothetical protein